MVLIFFTYTYLQKTLSSVYFNENTVNLTFVNVFNIKKDIIVPNQELSYNYRIERASKMTQTKTLRLYAKSKQLTVIFAGKDCWSENELDNLAEELEKRNFMGNKSNSPVYYDEIYSTINGEN